MLIVHRSRVFGLRLAQEHSAKTFLANEHEHQTRTMNQVNIIKVCQSVLARG